MRGLSFRSEVFKKITSETIVQPQNSQINKSPRHALYCFAFSNKNLLYMQRNFPAIILSEFQDIKCCSVLIGQLEKARKEIFTNMF